MATDNKSTQYDVVIRELRTDKEVKRIPGGSRSRAEKIDDGANINLDHEAYYTAIVEAD